jgi:hypothetical protein
MELPDVDIEHLRSFSGRLVHVRLDDASEHVGTLRTELLTDRSISVFLHKDGGEGATVYIDNIIDIRPG